MKNLVNTYFSEVDFEAIKNAVIEAEKKTSGEIVVRIASESHFWLAERLLVAAFAMLIGTTVSLALCHHADWGMYYDFSQAALWGLVAFLLGFLAIAPLMKTHSRRLGFVWRHALKLFHGLRTTKGQTGVLILVSLAECEAAIIADKGIAQKLPENYWNHPHAILTASMREDRHAEGLISAIREIGGRLAEHFPIQSDDINELPDAPEVVN